jgi:ribonuclease HII
MIHKGYGTELHQDALKRYGPTRIHRMTFAPIQALLTKENTP